MTPPPASANPLTRSTSLADSSRLAEVEVLDGGTDDQHAGCHQRRQRTHHQQGQGCQRGHDRVSLAVLGLGLRPVGGSRGGRSGLAPLLLLIPLLWLLIARRLVLRLVGVGVLVVRLLVATLLAVGAPARSPAARSRAAVRTATAGSPAGPRSQAAGSPAGRRSPAAGSPADTAVAARSLVVARTVRDPGSWAAADSRAARADSRAAGSQPAATAAATGRRPRRRPRARRTRVAAARSRESAAAVARRQAAAVERTLRRLRRGPLRRVPRTPAREAEAEAARTRAPAAVAVRHTPALARPGSRPRAAARTRVRAPGPQPRAGACTPGPAQVRWGPRRREPARPALRRPAAARTREREAARTGARALARAAALGRRTPPPARARAAPATTTNRAASSRERTDRHRRVAAPTNRAACSRRPQGRPSLAAAASHPRLARACPSRTRWCRPPSRPLGRSSRSSVYVCALPAIGAQCSERRGSRQCASGPEDARQLERCRRLQLVVAALGRLLVGAPAAEGRAVPEARALQVVVGDLADALRAKWLPAQVTCPGSSGWWRRARVCRTPPVPPPSRPSLPRGGLRGRSHAAAPAHRPARAVAPW